MAAGSDDRMARVLRMSRLLALGLIGVFFPAVAAPSAEPDWRPIARQCAAEIDLKSHCTTSCDNQLWPQYVRCVLHRVYGNQVNHARSEACIDRIWDERVRQQTCSLCGDPVKDTFDCLGAK